MDEVWLIHHFLAQTQTRHLSPCLPWDPCFELVLWFHSHWYLYWDKRTIRLLITEILLHLFHPSPFPLKQRTTPLNTCQSVILTVKYFLHHPVVVVVVVRSTSATLHASQHWMDVLLPTTSTWLGVMKDGEREIKHPQAITHINSSHPVHRATEYRPRSLSPRISSIRFSLSLIHSLEVRITTTT